jgi:hypothetical protein
MRQWTASVELSQLRNRFAPLVTKLVVSHLTLVATMMIAIAAIRIIVIVVAILVLQSLNQPVS